MPQIIGFTGYAGSGKDEAANALVERRGFVKIGFADPLREAMAALDPIVGSYTLGPPFGYTFETMRYNEAIAKFGYTEAKKKFPEIRELLQRFGTEVGREQFGANFWTDQAEKRIAKTLFDGCDVVITDVRFANEVELIKRLGGFVVRVLRPNVTAVNGHVSDTGVDDLKIDGAIANDSTIENLHFTTLAYIDNIGFRLDEMPVSKCDGFVEPPLPFVD